MWLLPLLKCCHTSLLITHYNFELKKKKSKKYHIFKNHSIKSKSIIACHIIYPYFLALVHILPRAVPKHSCPQLSLFTNLLLKENSIPSRGMIKSIKINFLFSICIVTSIRYYITFDSSIFLMILLYFKHYTFAKHHIKFELSHNNIF